MTGLTFRDDFERFVVDWLDETAGTSTLDYLDETLAELDQIFPPPRKPAHLRKKRLSSAGQSHRPQTLGRRRLTEPRRQLR